jgi:hypothetical protein
MWDRLTTAAYTRAVGTYVAFAAVAIGVGIGLLFLLRSFRRWQQPPPGRDPQARQAEARLWSTWNIEG